jgi:hypothetical protein
MLFKISRGRSELLIRKAGQKAGDLHDRGVSLLMVGVRMKDFSQCHDLSRLRV